MPIIHIQDPVRAPDGTIATIAKLVDMGKIRFEKSERFICRCHREGCDGSRTAYFAVWIADPSLVWEIGKLAYLSREGQNVELGAA